jgi:hypothetical protein
LGLGLCNLGARLGGICAPFALLVGASADGGGGAGGGSFVLIGLPCVLAGAVSLALPETLNTQMIESMDGFVAFHGGWKPCKQWPSSWSAWKSWGKQHYSTLGAQDEGSDNSRSVELVDRRGSGNAAERFSD